MFDTVLIALGASVAWGLADFRMVACEAHESLLIVAPLTQVGAFVFLFSVGVAYGLPSKHAPQVAILGATAGLAMAVSVVTLYGALAMGTMSLVAPLSGLSAALIPIGVGIIDGDPVTVAEILGMLAILVGMPLALVEGSDSDPTTRIRPWIVATAIVAIGSTLTLAGKGGELNPCGAPCSLAPSPAACSCRAHGLLHTAARFHLGSPTGWH